MEYMRITLVWINKYGLTTLKLTEKNLNVEVYYIQLQAKLIIMTLSYFFVTSLMILKKEVTVCNVHYLIYFSELEPLAHGELL